MLVQKWFADRLKSHMGLTNSGEASTYIHSCLHTELFATLVDKLCLRTQHLHPANATATYTIQQQLTYIHICLAIAIKGKENFATNKSFITSARRTSSPKTNDVENS